MIVDAKTKHKNHGNLEVAYRLPSFLTGCQTPYHGKFEAIRRFPSYFIGRQTPYKIKYKVRKGQFFLVGAIIIILALYMLSNTLSKTTHIDCADVQDNNPIWTIEETEKGLYQITRKNLTERSRIDEFIGMQKEIAKENGYALGFDMLNYMPYGTGFPNIYTITLESNQFYIEKADALLPYYSDCKAVEGACFVLDFLVPGYERACCKAHRICC